MIVDMVVEVTTMLALASTNLLQLPVEMAGATVNLHLVVTMTLGMRHLLPSRLETVERGRHKSSVGMGTVQYSGLMMACMVYGGSAVGQEWRWHSL